MVRSNDLYCFHILGELIKSSIFFKSQAWNWNVAMTSRVNGKDVNKINYTIVLKNRIIKIFVFMILLVGYNFISFIAHSSIFHYFITFIFFISLFFFKTLPLTYSRIRCSSIFLPGLNVFTPVQF